MDNYMKKLDALSAKQEEALQKFRETRNETYRQEAMLYCVEKIKLLTSTLKDAGMVRMEIKNIKSNLK